VTQGDLRSSPFIVGGTGLERVTPKLVDSGSRSVPVHSSSLMATSRFYERLLIQAYTRGVRAEMRERSSSPVTGRSPSRPASLGPLRGWAPPLLASLVVACGATGCGGHQGHARLRVVSISLSASVGFPGSPLAGITLTGGRTFARVARLVPLPLPPTFRLDPTETTHPLTVCFPMDLRIGLSNGQNVLYPSCYRPKSLRPVVRALCPLLHVRGLCARYRHELAVR
jgi:hypothetical protein